MSRSLMGGGRQFPQQIKQAIQIRKHSQAQPVQTILFSAFILDLIIVKHIWWLHQSNSFETPDEATKLWYFSYENAVANANVRQFFFSMGIHFTDM